MRCLACLCHEGVYNREVEVSLAYSHFLSFGKDTGDNTGVLEGRVQAIVERGIIPCVTAWCERCRAVTPLSNAEHETYADALADLIQRQQSVDLILGGYKAGAGGAAGGTSNNEEKEN